ncbi:Probable sugar phosphate/phosphate translocator At3g17430 [Linum grandiflorum]
MEACLIFVPNVIVTIGRIGAVTIRVAGVLKDWILIALSTVIFPESAITGLNIIGYAIALCSVVMYNYLKVREVRASSQRKSVYMMTEQDWKLEKKSSDIFVPSDGSGGAAANVLSSSDGVGVDEEVPLIASSRLSHNGRSQASNHNVG